MATNIVDLYALVEEAIVDYLETDVDFMLKTTYDANTSGVVDDSEKLNNQSASYYLDWSNFTSAPTTIAGYGITDAYTETEVDDALALKANLASPTFTGTVSGITATMVGLGNVTNESKATMFTSATLTSIPTAPTASATTDTIQIATTAFVQQEIAYASTEW